ncbi:hypothetical protein VU01_14371, partial [Candidatus Electrothrix marina]
EKLNFFFELDKEEQEDLTGDRIPAAEDDDVVTAGALAESDAHDEEQGEASSEFLELDEELDEDSSELSFDDEEDFEGDIAGFSDMDDTEAVSVTADQGDKSVSDSEEEIEGLDAIFDLDDDAEGTPEFDTSSTGGPEEIPALEDEFVVSLDEEDSTDELFDFSSDSGEEKSDVSPDLAEDAESKESLFGLEEDSDKEVAAAEAELGDEFALSFGDEETSDDDFSFDSEDDVSDTSSEAVEESEVLDSFFELEEESGGESASATAVSHDEVEEEADLEDEFTLSLDDEESSDDEFSLLFDNDESGEEAVPSELSTSEEAGKAEEVEEVVDLDDEFTFFLDDEESDEDAEGFDSFLDLEEELGESFEAEKTKDVSSIEEPVEEIKLDDDELSEFSFGGDEDEVEGDTGAVVSESVSEPE